MSPDCFMEAVLLIGSHATGKTTFYREQFADTHAHISLDVLKTRGRERDALYGCLRNRQPFVIDNTNVRAAERAGYIAGAQQAGFPGGGYFLDGALREGPRSNAPR